jgi:hypothetical protein
MFVNDAGHGLLGKAQDSGDITQSGTLHLGWGTMPHYLDPPISGTEGTDSPTNRTSPVQKRGVAGWSREPPDN